MKKVLRKAMGELRDDRKKQDKTVDIVGFSRGGIEAIEFAHLVAKEFPDERIRFVGLFDPVGSVGFPGCFAGYRHFDLPEGVEYSASAMAQDENRCMFPATDVYVNFQQWFRGIHSDIGGFFKDHDIADHVLEWMTGHAQNAGVSMDLTSVKQKYGWKPNPNGQIHRNHGVTSWFTRSASSGGRHVIADFGTYTVGLQY
jgi:hypothetical protein